MFTLYRIVHPDACFKQAKHPRRMSQIGRCDGGEERDCGESAYNRRELCMEDDRCVGRPGEWWVRNDGHVNE